MSPCAYFALVLVLVAHHGVWAYTEDQCTAIAQRFSERYNAVPYSPGNASRLAYFLHVPRTAGRTFYSCFVKPAFPPSKRCPKSYDQLRLDSGCSVLASHDDFSIVDELPGDAAMYSQIRDPVDRMFSAYEMAMEVGLRYSDPRFLSRMRERNRKGLKEGRLNQLTIDIWPWSVLAPLFARDIYSRRQRRMMLRPEMNMRGKDIWVPNRDDLGRLFYYNFMRNVSRLEADMGPEDLQKSIPELNAYDNPLYLTFSEFVRLPETQGSIWNGQAFQLLGLTSYSRWEEASALRACSVQYRSIEETLSGLALTRLRALFHVGTFEQMTDSMASLAAALGIRIDENAWGFSQDIFSYEDERLPAHTELPFRRSVRPRRPVGSDHSHAHAHEHNLPESRRQLLRSPDTDLEVAAEAFVADKVEVLMSADGSAEISDEDAEELYLYDDDDDGEEEENDEEVGEEEEMSESESEEEEGGEQRSARQLAAVRRKQVRSDSVSRLAKSLRDHVASCAATAHQRSIVQRRKELLRLRTEEGQWPTFSSTQRKAMDPEVLHFVESTNRMDRRLHDEAQRLLRRRIEQLKAAGQWQDPPSLTPRTGLGGAVEGQGEGQGDDSVDGLSALNRAEPESPPPYPFTKPTALRADLHRAKMTSFQDLVKLRQLAQAQEQEQPQPQQLQQKTQRPLQQKQVQQMQQIIAPRPLPEESATKDPAKPRRRVSVVRTWCRHLQHWWAGGRGHELSATAAEGQPASGGPSENRNAEGTAADGGLEAKSKASSPASAASTTRQRQASTSGHPQPVPPSGFNANANANSNANARPRSAQGMAQAKAQAQIRRSRRLRKKAAGPGGPDFEGGEAQGSGGGSALGDAGEGGRSREAEAQGAREEGVKEL